MYQPLRVFFFIGVVLSVLGVIPVMRFIFFYFTEGGAGHIQSLILGGTLLVIGFVTFLIGLVADLINYNRQLIEMTLEKVRRMELSASGIEDKNDTASSQSHVGEVRHRAPPEQ